MAGSGLPPLTNIPYCCLPQESGPCLSASVGGRPLRPPTHRRLGGPSPRLPSNGTHARPQARLRFTPPGMPQAGTTAAHPAFPPAVRRSGVGCIRVAHPSAALRAPEGALPARLACIRPAASVHPEPGSNSSLYYCCLPISSVSWAPHCSLFLLSRSADPTSRPRRLPVLASSFQRTPAKLPSSKTLFLSFAGCKNTTFSHNNNDFSQIFFVTTHKTMIIKKKKF